MKLYMEDEVNNAEYYSKTEILDKKTFEKRIKLIQEITHLKKGRILDYGCSTGNFLEVARKHKYSVIGKELNKKSISICRKKRLDVRSSITEKDFDLIHAGDILEHMQYPKKFVKELGTHLKKDGFLVMATPDFTNFITRMTQIKPKEHLFYFTPKGLKYLLENNGFEIIYLKGCKRYRSVETLLSGSTSENKYVRFILKLTQRLGLEKLFNWYISNMEDDMLVIAKKIGN